MEWLILALIAPVFWSLTVILDRIILTKFKVRSFDYMILGGFAWIVNLIFLPLTELSKISFGIIIFVIVAGALRVLSLFYYVKAIQVEDASRLTPLFNITNVYILVLSIIFLGEILTNNQVLAFVLILTGGIILGFKRNKRRIIASPALGFTLLNTFFFSISIVMMKYAFNFISFWDSVVLLAIGEVLGVCFFLLGKNKFNTFWGNVKKYDKKFWILLTGSVFFALGGYLISNRAFQLGPIALVNVIGGFNAVFVLIWATALSKYFPKILKEKYNFKILLLKSFSISLMMIGLYLLSK